MVNTTQTSYDLILPSVILTRDCIAGDDNIKTKKTIYVPKLAGQDNDEYLAMLNRPVYENYTERTLDALTGLIFSKLPVIDANTRLTEMLKDIDLKGRTVIDFAQNICKESLCAGRVGILVDMPSIENEDITIAQAEAMNIRPFWKIYPTESIINWRYETVNNRENLVMVVLRETYDEWISEFVHEAKERYRVLKLENGIYKQEIYIGNDKDGFNITDEFYPKMNGQNMNFIPFVSVADDDLSIEPKKPPLYDFAKVNLQYFKTDVEHCHGLHFTGLPTAWGAGIQLEKGETIDLGSSTAQVFPDPQAKLEYLEFSGDGLQGFERKLEKLKETMAILGARMLNADKKVAEAENTLAMRTSGERAILISVADTVSRGLTKALEITADWMNIPQGSITLNTDYNLTQLDAQSITALVTAWQTKALSQRDLFYNFKKGELIDEATDFETYQTYLNDEVTL